MMEEAEAMCGELALQAFGRWHAVGSSEEIIKRYGGGYVLEIQWGTNFGDGNLLQRLLGLRGELLCSEVEAGRSVFADLRYGLHIREDLFFPNDVNSQKLSQYVDLVFENDFHGSRHKIAPEVLVLERVSGNNGKNRAFRKRKGWEINVGEKRVKPVDMTLTSYQDTPTSAMPNDFNTLAALFTDSNEMEVACSKFYLDEVLPRVLKRARADEIAGYITPGSAYLEIWKDHEADSQEGNSPQQIPKKDSKEEEDSVRIAEQLIMLNPPDITEKIRFVVRESNGGDVDLGTLSNVLGELAERDVESFVLTQLGLDLAFRRFAAEASFKERLTEQRTSSMGI